jgi:hypothetical protein
MVSLRSCPAVSVKENWGFSAVSMALDKFSANTDKILPDKIEFG